MAEFEYQNVEAWNTSVKLAASVGRLKIGSNLKASENAQRRRSSRRAGLALIAEGSGREGPAQSGCTGTPGVRWRSAARGFTSSPR